jgi:toxin CptA
MTLKPSIRLASLLAAMHCCAIYLVLSQPIPEKFWIAALVLADMVHTIMRHALLMSPSSVVFLKVDGNECTLFLKNGREVRSALLDSTYVSPYLTILNLKEKKRLFSRSVIIASDAVDREEFRALRVRLEI